MSLLFLPQFWNQYILLLLPLGLMGGWALWLFFRRRKWKGWLIWSGVLTALLAGFWFLQTPAATVYNPRSDEPGSTEPSPGAFLSLQPTFNSPEEIRRFLALYEGRPTLVDFYTDYGLS